MDKKYFILFAIMINSIIIAQNLTANELIALRKLSVVELEEKLINKGWEYYSSKNNPNFLNRITFTYNKSEYNDKAESFITYFWENSNSTSNQVSVQIHEKRKYLEYLNKVKSFKPKLIKSDVNSNGIKKIYQGATTTYIFQIENIEEENVLYNSISKKSFYSLEILSNLYYNYTNNK
ncbi:hypothetical protein UJ101_02031 [Flavobacteriaceae bacterium UJ101]|nr:hypothetical protein UJ101_02031 [Flavobacteriaceae bacterium UJ101]